MPSGTFFVAADLNEERRMVTNVASKVAQIVIDFVGILKIINLKKKLFGKV